MYYVAQFTLWDYGWTLLTDIVSRFLPLPYIETFDQISSIPDNVFQTCLRGIVFKHFSSKIRVDDLVKIFLLKLSLGFPAELAVN